METTTTYSIPENNFGFLIERLGKLAKRAKRLGCAPITWKVTGEHEVKKCRELGFDYIVKYFDLEVTGETPKFEGWQFVAVLQRMEMEDLSVEGLLRVLPGQDCPRELAERLGQCDHCRTDRPRNDTYVVRHDSGIYKLVGSSCIRDFLGHNSPQALAAAAELLCEGGELLRGAEDEGYFGGSDKPSRFSVDMVLTFAACIIRLDGFMSKSKASEQFAPEKATAHTLSMVLTANPKLSSDDRELLKQYQSSEKDGETAEAAREWAREQAESNNDYLYNLSLIARSASLELRNLGLACAMIASYQREMIQRNSTGIENSQHFGEVGKRERYSLTFLGSTQRESDFGVTTICRFNQNGNLAVWFASGEPCIDFAIGETYDVLATVKKHQTFGGKAQTVLNRVAPYVEKVKKAAKPRKAKAAPAEAVAA